MGCSKCISFPGSKDYIIHLFLKISPVSTSEVPSPRSDKGGNSHSATLYFLLAQSTFLFFSNLREELKKHITMTAPP